MKELTQAFNYIQFNDQYHTYYNREDGIRMESTTRFISKFFPEFRRKYWLAWDVVKNKIRPHYECKSDFAKDVPIDHFKINGKHVHMDFIHKKYPNAIATVKADWKRKSDIGKEKGKFLHNHLELLSAQKSLNINDYPEFARPFIVSAEEYYYEYLPVAHAREFVVGDREFNIAGMPDFYGDTNVLRDYKTDKNLSGSFPSYCKRPINHMRADQMTKHSFQLTMYKYMIEKHTDIRIQKMEIVNFEEVEHDKNGNPTKVQHVIYDVPDLYNELMLILSYDKKFD